MKKALCFLAATALLTGCGQAERMQSCMIQEVYQLHPEQVLYTESIPSTEPSEEATEEAVEPASPASSAECMKAVWIPYLLYEDWMQDRSREEFQNTVCDAWERCAELGINTLFVHVRSFGDAYYASDLFPRGKFWDGSYDPFAIMLEEAHADGLSVHAWINPMRCDTPERIAASGEAYPLCRWLSDAEKNGRELVEWNGICYLNPACPDARQLIADGVEEILDRYHPDGIHIDDYFYPTTDPSFDAEVFAESGWEELAEWRRNNCTEMVKAIHAVTASREDPVVFGISPQGNPENCREKLYADAAAWCAEGNCDYIVPQLYYGFENSSCPFAETADRWQEIAGETSLILGLAPYKIGSEDIWAGDGISEWITDPDLLTKETAHTLSSEGMDGVAFYSYAELFGERTEQLLPELQALLRS